MWTVRPKLTEQMRLGIGIVAALLLVRAIGDIGHPRPAMIDLISFGPFAALGLAVLALALRNSRLMIDHETVTKIGGLGGRRSWSRSDVARVDRFSTIYHVTTRYVVFVGYDGRALFTLNSGIWDVDRVIGVCRHARIHLSGRFTDLESPFGLNRRVPGMRTWREVTIDGLVVAAIAVLVTFAALRFGPASGG